MPTPHLRALACLLLVLPFAVRAAPLAIAVSQSPSSLPLYVAERLGYFAAEGVPAKLVACRGGAHCLRTMFDGKAALATASDLPAVTSRFERSDVVVIATFATSRDDVKLIARKGAGIRTAAHLAGKLVGASAGSIGHYMLDRWLHAHDVDPHNVALLDLQPAEMAAALRDGEVDAVAVWEPHGWRLVRAFPDKATPLEQSSNQRQGFNLLAMRGAAGADDAELARLLRALKRAERYIRERPREAQALLRERLGLDRRFVLSIWSGFEFRLELDKPVLVTTFDALARWMLREGYAKGGAAPALEGWLHDAPLEAALSGVN